MKYSEKDMAALISEVEAQFADHLAKAEASQEEETLEKSEEAVEAAQTEEAPVAATEETEVQMQKSEEKTETQEFDYDEEDIAEMDKMYASMTKSEAEAHLESIQRALGSESEEVVEEAPQAIEKSEEAQEVEAKSEEDSESEELLKSEVESLKKENEELKKSFENLTSALTKFVKKGAAPRQKAITRIEYLAKSEDEVIEEKKEEDFSKLSKSEISDRLNQKIREGKLEKSDRDKINQYYLDNAKLETIKHLLV